jgi:hypothetical protein
MGQINILITIDTDKLLKEIPDGGEIPHPELYAVVQDDEAFDTNDPNIAEIVTIVYPGTILMWTIKSLTFNHKVQFTSIEIAPGIFLESPVLFCNQRKCVAVVNKTIKQQKYGYYIEFFIDGDAGKTWYWDPTLDPHTTKP